MDLPRNAAPPSSVTLVDPFPFVSTPTYTPPPTPPSPLHSPPPVLPAPHLPPTDSPNDDSTEVNSCYPIRSHTPSSHLTDYYYYATHIIDLYEPRPTGKQVHTLNGLRKCTQSCKLWSILVLGN